MREREKDDSQIQVTQMKKEKIDFEWRKRRENAKCLEERRKMRAHNKRMCGGLERGRYKKERKKEQNG